MRIKTCHYWCAQRLGLLMLEFDDRATQLFVFFIQELTWDMESLVT